VRAERLGAGASAAAVLRGLHERARRLRLPPPAALTGEWFGSAAVLVPSVSLAPCAVNVAFTAAPEVAKATFTTRGEGVGGGWIGYRGYPDGSGALPEAAGGWTDCVLRLDNDGCWWFESLSGALCPPELTAVIAVGTAASPWQLIWTVPDAAAHRDRVRHCLAAIVEGEVYQACVCTRFTGTLSGKGVHLFAAGIEADSPARAAYLTGRWGSIASFSPELFLARHGRTVRSSPIKGTLPIERDPAVLRACAKDVAENVMIVDLVRNDLGRVCLPGSISVPELLAVHAVPAVWHLVSTVEGVLRSDVTDTQLLDATFPPASVTGTPKHRARELISDWETAPRGVYCGAIGMTSPVAGFELNVAIRTVEIDGHGSTALGVGGGITIDSEPEAEWQECLHKAAAITRLQARSASDTVTSHWRPLSVNVASWLTRRSRA